MERDNFNPYKFESSSEKSDDKKDDKKKKKSATDLAKLLARQDTAAEKEKPKEPEPGGGASPLEKVLTEKKAEQSSETADDARETDHDVPLESLSPAEETETAQAYVAERAHELATESDNTPDTVAETEANQAFIEALRQRLDESGGQQSPDEAIENAFQDIADSFETDDDSSPAQAEETHENIPPANELHDFDPDHAVPLTPPVGGSGGGGRPPVPLVAPTPAFGEEPRPFGGRSTSASSEIGPMDAADRAVYERRAAGRGLLVGGVVGYLIGRRRGRIKTEKRLAVVQEKLEKQVEQVQQIIEQKELAIRKLAREKGRISPEANRQFASSVERQSAPTPEKKAASSSAESTGGKPESMNAAVDSLSKEELLAFSGQIRVGETSLRRVFEAKMIDEKGLRRLIKEYQAGHDLRRALAREFMVKELKFERDPTLRDLLPVEAQPRRQGEANDVDGADGGRVLGGVASVPSPGAHSTQAGQQTAADKTGTSNAAARRSVRGRQSNVSPLVLISLTLFTIILALYAIWLTITG